MRFISKDSEFFDLFDRQVKDLVTITELLRGFAQDFKDSEAMRTKFKEAEHEADITTHEIIEKVNRTFITPIDREDIHSLAQAMDDVVDLIDASAGRVFLYEIRQPTEEMKRFVEIIHKMVQEIAKTIGMLRNLKNPRRLLDHCIEINRLENEADATLLSGIEKLVKNRQDFFEFMRWKEVYESLESATDKCEDVANIIEGIVIKSV